jgi:general secretion pathway protein G
MIVIIGIFLSIPMPNIDKRLNQERVNKLRMMATKAIFQGIETVLQDYEMNVGGFPTSKQGLQALVKCPSDVTTDDWGDTPYLKEIPRDAWNQEFIYKQPGEHNAEYDLCSKGRDEKENTKDDIHNWPDENEKDF